MEWKTRITDLFGIKYPIIEGAYGGFGTWEFAKAVSDAGGLGLITAGASRTPDRLREDIEKFRDACDKPFAVNLSFGPCPQIEEMFEVCLEKKIEIIETAGYKPDLFAARIEETDMKWIHKCTRVKDAVHAEHIGADAIIIVGLEGVGFKNPDQLPTLINMTTGRRALNVPLIAAGGLGDASGFLGALGMGADGIMLATVLMATKECPITDRLKEGMVNARADDPQLRHRVLTTADPAEYAEVMKLRGTMPEMDWLRKVEGVRPKPYPGAKETGPQSANQGSLAVGLIDTVPTIKELIDGIISDAENILDSWEFLKTR
jgi:nitronate monooxygenase